MFPKGEIQLRLANADGESRNGGIVTIDLDRGTALMGGRRVNLALAPGDVAIPEEIPTYLAGYKPFQFRADEVSPYVLVNKSEDQYRTFSSDDTFRAVNVKASLQQKIPEIDPSSSLTTYTTVDRLIGSFIPDRTEENATGKLYRPRQVAAQRCKRALMLDREIDVWTMLTTNGNWAAANITDLTAGQKWNDGADSNPILDLQTAMEASAQEVTGIWMNRKVANAFIRHAYVREHMRQMLGDSAVDRSIGAVNSATPGATVDFSIPGFPLFHVTSAKVKNETTAALDYVLSNHTVLVTSVGGTPQDGEEIATTYTFRCKGRFGVGFDAREFRVEDRGNGGTMVVCAMSDIAKMTGNNCGGLIRDCVV
jgi:hypothetical protein